MPVGADVPFPLNATVNFGLFVSLLLIVNVPVAAPVVVAVYATVIEADCPALITFGVVIPVNPNPVPEMVTEEIVRSAFPMLATVRV